MAQKEKSSGMRSAYEAALERLEARGIERPREEALTEAVKEQIAEIRRKAEADLAQAEILYRDRLKSTHDPLAREKEEEEYQEDRRRIEAARNSKIEALKSSVG